MEFIFGLVILFVLFGIFRWVVSLGTRTVVAASRTATGSGSFSENMSAQFRGMEAFEAQYIWDEVGDKTKYRAIVIQGRGVVPVSRRTNIGFITSVFDTTGDEAVPVLSVIDSLQEPKSVVFQNLTESGYVEPNQGYISWTQIGAIIPEFLTPPYGGQRELTVITRMVDLNQSPVITHGFMSDTDGAFVRSWTWTINHNFVGVKGYEENSEDHEETGALTVKLAVAVAMSDGHLADEEGTKIQEWILKTIEPHSEQRSETLKARFNDALRDAHSLALSGELTAGETVIRLNEIAETYEKFEAVELCMDIMAADNVASTEEMVLIRNVTRELGLDFDEVAAMLDQRLVNLTPAVAAADPSALLGIDDSWSGEQTRLHLNSEFLKWSNRTASLSDPEELENARAMLDLIAKARLEYAERI
jgi:hypothetical protein